MSISSFSFPTAIKFGIGASKLVAAHLVELGLKRPLIVTDKALAALPVLAQFRATLNGLDAAVYAGMPVTRLTVIALMISGALGGFLALNEVMGSQNRLTLEFSGGYGFVGIAVALMGRSRSIGIILAAILFGALYQGGAELAFDKPNITRDMVVLVQGLVILMAGALEHMLRPTVGRLFAGCSTTATAQEA